MQRLVRRLAGAGEPSPVSHLDRPNRAGLRLPYILPHDVRLYWWLRQAHTVLAYLFFLTFLAHFGAVLFHTFVVRDDLLLRMVPWRIRPRGPESASEPTPV